MKSRIFVLLIFSLALGIVGCTSFGGKRVAHHALEFNAKWDSPDVTILDYRYGSTDATGTRPPASMRINGQSPQQSSVYGLMAVGDELYVKWKVRATGEIFEKTVVLLDILPFDIEDNTIYFQIKDNQLYIFLISPKARPASVAPNGPKGFSNRLVTTIYPK